jgi:hypothetical protein
MPSLRVQAPAAGVVSGMPEVVVPGAAVVVVPGAWVGVAFSAKTIIIIGFSKNSPVHKVSSFPVTGLIDNINLLQLSGNRVS